MPILPAKLAPPVQEKPLLDDGGQHSQAWAEFHQSVADRIKATADQLATLQATVHTGVIDASDADAGQVGEFISGTFAAAAIADNISVNVGSISLTAGDWEVSGTVRYPSSTLGMTIAQGWVSTASATAQDPWRTLLSLGGAGTNVFASGIRLVTMPRRLNINATTTVYLGAYVKNAGAGSSTVEGYISARRMR
jgi:hypothetical protein